MKSALKGWITFLILIFAPSLAMSASYPPQIAQKLRHAVPLVDCKRNVPTNIHIRYYESRDDTWTAYVLGRNGKDVMILFVQPARVKNGSVMADIYYAQSNGWKSQTMAIARRMDKMIRIFTQEEKNFLGKCGSNPN